ncbi:hypothetical protein SCUCBS95973_005579 [Sporothrix curviconia]|uniref:Uncharacterized protein n=1 Tax=Sporothrix curviconia TaxID=1260050 RepID=A0ABP0BYS5_9PEZI
MPSFSLPSKATLVALSLVPVVAPAIFLVAIQAITSRSIASSAVQRRVLTKKDKDAITTSSSSSSSALSVDATTAANAIPPHSLPDEVYADNAPYVVYCERVVSRPIPVSKLTADDDNGLLLTTYLRGTMGAFSWTPMGLTLRSFISDPALRATFDAEHIETLAFRKDDVACGPHLVTYRSGDRAEMMTQLLADKPDMVVHAVIVAAVERLAETNEVVFVNETWFWRHAQDEQPSLLESAAGRWLHDLIGSWMIFKGTAKVTTVAKKTKAE